MGKGESRGRCLSFPTTLPACYVQGRLSHESAAPSPSLTHVQVFLQNRFSGISDTTAAFCLQFHLLAPGKNWNKGSDNVMKDSVR